MRDANRSTFNGDPYIVGSVPLKIYATNGTSSANGALTFTIPAGVFTNVYAATATAVRNTADPALACFALVRSATPTQVVVQVFESKTSGVLLGGVVEGLEATASATVVALTVFGA